MLSRELAGIILGGASMKKPFVLAYSWNSKTNSPVEENVFFQILAPQELRGLLV